PCGAAPRTAPADGPINAIRPRHSRPPPTLSPPAPNLSQPLIAVMSVRVPPPAQPARILAFDFRPIPVNERRLARGGPPAPDLRSWSPSAASGPVVMYDAMLVGLKERCA